MPYIPHSAAERDAMLGQIGVAGMQDLFDEIPQELRYNGALAQVPAGLTESELLRLMQQRATENTALLCFAGGGAYEHSIPAAVWPLVSRGEFYSAYTPYQAEASQGTLQLIYEFQSMIARLCDLPVANASLYDGATALAEAVLMAVRANRKDKSRRVLLPATLHPAYRRVVQSIVAYQDINCVTVPMDAVSGQVDEAACATALAEGAAALVIPGTNYLGRVENTDALVDLAHAQSALAIAVVNPIALALLAPPGAWGSKGVDIACGEGQPLGVPLSAGGPYFGFMTCQQALIRQMPGRIVGRTQDSDGAAGFVLTLQAREQHIRRSKATSNICTNQGLLVTAASIYMSLMGDAGLRSVALHAHANTRRLVALCTAIPGVSEALGAAAFHERVILLPCDDVAALVQRMARDHGILAGIPLAPDYPELANGLLVCATESRSEADLQAYAAALRTVLS